MLGIRAEIAIALFMLAKGQSQPGGGLPVQGGTMSIRTICSFLAAAALLCARFIPSALAQTEAEPEPAKVKKVTARLVLEAAYAKTGAAETVDDFSEIIEQCERVLGAKLTAENSAYAHELAAWGYNKRGEAYASQAATLAEQGEERKANELDDVALADFESALTHDPKKWKAIQNRGVSFALRGRMEEAMTPHASSKVCCSVRAIICCSFHSRASTCIRSITSSSPGTAAVNRLAHCRKRCPISSGPSM